MDDLTRAVIAEIKRRDPNHFSGLDRNTRERISPNTDSLHNWRDLPLATILVDALEKAEQVGMEPQSGVMRPKTLEGLGLSKGEK